MMKLAEIENEKEFQVSQKVSRKSYSLKFKLECLDYFKENGSGEFWRDYRGKVAMKTFHQWRKDEEKLRKFAEDRVGVDEFRRNRSSRYRVIFPELHDWASSKQNVSRKELKTQGSILMVRSKLAPGERTPLGHLSFNDMILAKFLKEYGNEFVKKPSYLPSANENSKFVCDICNYRLATKETLRRHQLVHSTDRFWQCVLCEVRFKHFHGAISHGWKKHGQKINPVKIGKEEVEQLKIRRGAKGRRRQMSEVSDESDDEVILSLAEGEEQDEPTADPDEFEDADTPSPPPGSEFDFEGDNILDGSSLEVEDKVDKENCSPLETGNNGTSQNVEQKISIEEKIEALDFFDKNGKRKFWKKYKGSFTQKMFSKWKSKEEELRRQFMKRAEIPGDRLDMESKEINTELREVKAEPREIMPLAVCFPSAEETAEKTYPRLKNLTMEQRAAIGAHLTTYPDAKIDETMAHFELLWGVKVPKNKFKNIFKSVSKEVANLDEHKAQLRLEIIQEQAERENEEPISFTSNVENPNVIMLQHDSTDRIIRPSEISRKRPSISSPFDNVKRIRNDSISSMSSSQSFGSSVFDSADSCLSSKDGRKRMRLARRNRPSEAKKVLDFTAVGKLHDEPVCADCECLAEGVEGAGELIKCSGVCQGHFHRKCMDSSSDSSEDEPVCSACRSGVQRCFDCGELIFTHRGPMRNGAHELVNPDKDVKCGEPGCGKYYHLSCLLKHKYSKYDKKFGKWTCPRHECQSCAKLIKQNEPVPVKKSKVVLKCARCPSAFHQDAACLPAGSFLIGGKYILCPKHFCPMPKKALHRPIHSNSCFVCNGGGELIICDGCPAAYHSHCADEDPQLNDDALALLMNDDDDASWFCQFCKAENPINYGDLLWTKAGVHRWWPSLVVMPNQIPPNVFKIKSGPGEFCVKYLGTNDYNWMNRGRCFPYRGKDNDPHMVASYHKDILAKTNRTAKEQQFHDALVEAEKLLQAQIKNTTNSGKYKQLKVNKPFAQNTPHLVRDSSFSKGCSCSCTPTSNDPCGDMSDCENRCLQIECSSDCPSGEKCQNQRFRRRLYPELERFKTSWGGFGLKVKKSVEKGTFIIEYVGEIIDIAESKRRLQEDAAKGVSNFYQINLDRERLIDSGKAGNNSRFINHSCEPNCETQTWEVNGDLRIGIFALKNIHADTELTFDYKLTQAGTAKTKCLCGAANCAGFIGDPIRRDREVKKEDKSQKKKKSKNKKSKKA